MLTDKLSVTSKTEEKLDYLTRSLQDMSSAVIAFSGGVDSSLLSVIATEVIGKNSLIVFAKSPVVPDAEFHAARKLAKQWKFNYLEIEHDQLEMPEFVCNSRDRCYHCKVDLLRRLKQLASGKKIKWVCEGSNYDDLGDYRPGLRAVADLAVRSPLAESFMTKAEIRETAKQRGLENWDKPSSPCLASRVPYGTNITPEILEKIEKCEAYLKDLGIKQVRLRHHGDVARIEVAEPDICILAESENRKKVIEAIKNLGYKYVALDLQGFRSGSLNEVL
jgi:pyridinium-3,5-biscarboxylic acid mononucleotide sulfurtransferase